MNQPLHPPPALRPDLRAEWLLDPNVTFLNHGSFGAAPKCVLVEQMRWRMRIEAEPVEMLARRGAELIADAKRAIGNWLGMREEDFGLVSNASEGINSVLRSLKFGPGDELLTTTHVYGAVRQAMKFAAAGSGAGYREIELPLPIPSADWIAERVLEGVSPKTRLLVIDHITSPTAVIFPVERIVAGCADRGVDVLVDGAHGPGMVPLNVPGLGAAYYAGNLHKWACGPKGSAFLWVRPDRQPGVHPLVISHYLGEGFAREFEWQGTRDLSGWLSVPSALQFMAELGWDQVMHHNHAMAAWMQQALCERWGVEPISPPDGSLLGSMATVRLPAPLEALSEADLAVYQRRLYLEHQIEAPLVRWGGQCFVRPCCQVYNGPEDYERLGEVIANLHAH